MRMTIFAVLFFVTSAYAQPQQKKTQEPRRAGTLAQQKMCADQAKKSVDDPYFKANLIEYSSHYDANTKVCYVLIRQDVVKNSNTGTEKIVGYSVWDAFERTERARLATTFPVPPNGKSDTFVCYVRPVGMSTTQYPHGLIDCLKHRDQTDNEEFFGLIKEHFGLERP